MRTEPETKNSGIRLMKTKRHALNHWPRPHALLAVACGFAIELEATESKPPVFKDIPGVTSPLPPQPLLVAAATQAPQAAQPPPTTLPLVPEDKIVYSFQASDLDLRTALATFARAPAPGDRRQRHCGVCLGGIKHHPR